MSDAELIDAFCDQLWLADGLAATSLASYRRDLTAWSVWLDARGLLSATRADVEAWLADQFRAKAKASSVARRLSATDTDRRIRILADSCGIGPILDKPISQLSKGLRQRVGVAQALLHDPPVLIMDEPTAGLDPNQIAEFHDQIRTHSRTKTILVSTHSLQEVQSIADRVLFIHRGRLIFDGSPAQLSAGVSLEVSFRRLTQDPAHEPSQKEAAAAVGERR